MDTIISILFIMFGIISLANPKLMIEIKVRLAQEVAGAKLTPSKKTEQVTQILGALLIVVGLLLLQS